MLASWHTQHGASKIRIFHFYSPWASPHLFHASVSRNSKQHTDLHRCYDLLKLLKSNSCDLSETLIALLFSSSKCLQPLVLEPPMSTSTDAKLKQIAL